MPVIGAHHTSYSVKDMDETLAFYRDLLGFEVVSERPEIKNQYFRDIVGFTDSVVRDAVLRIPGTTHLLELFEYKHPRGTAQTLTPNNPGSSHICYLVDDLQALWPTLQAAGVKAISRGPIYLDEGPNRGGWAMYIQDPNGIPIELFQRATSGE